MGRLELTFGDGAETAVVGGGLSGVADVEGVFFLDVEEEQAGEEVENVERYCCAYCGLRGLFEEELVDVDGEGVGEDDGDDDTGVAGAGHGIELAA